MDQERISKKPTGLCERIFKALTNSPVFKAICCVFHHPQSSFPNRPAAAPHDIQKTKPSSAQVSQQHQTLGNGKVDGVVPVIFEPTPTNGKEKLAMNDGSKAKANMAEQEKKVPGLEVKAPQQSEEGKKTTPKSETIKPSPAKPPVEPGQQIVQGNEGKKTTPKSETIKPSPANPPAEQGQQIVQGGEGKKTGPTSKDRFTDFIDKTKLKLRAMSDVGKSNPEADVSHAKIKTKTPSNIGEGQSISFKK